jgi:two-component system sensor histidine kinase CpxA
MTLPLSLRAKVLLLVALNLAVMALILGAVAASQMTRPFDSFLMSATRQRLDGLARSVMLEAQRTDVTRWDALLARESAAHGVTLMLVRNDGGRIAGPDLALPDDLVQTIRGPAREGPGHQPPREPLPPPPDGPRRGRPEGDGLPPFPPTAPFLVHTKAPAPGAPAYWVGLRVPVRRPGTEETIKGTLLAATNRFWTHPLFFDLRPWITMGALAVAVSLTCWIPFVGGLTSSVGEMTRATEAIAGGRFDVRLATGRADELGRLARSISAMAQRLEALMRGQKRFLADAAHEIRSPLGRMQAALGILESRLGAREGAVVGDLREEVELMVRLTDELLAFARAELGPEMPRLVRTNVAETARRALRLEAPEGTDVRLEVATDLHVRADPDYLFRSLSNVLRNAIQHAGTSGPIALRARPEGDRVVITVADSGPGLPPSTLTRIFEPFYRPEESRDRRSGGTGLGLAIVRSCVEACGGSVECGNRDPSGLVVTITLAAA